MLLIESRALLALDPVVNWLLHSVNIEFTVAGIMAKQPPVPKTDQEAYALVLSKVSKSNLAQACGISRQAVQRWEVVPAKYLKQVASAAGLSPRHVLPSLFE